MRLKAFTPLLLAIALLAACTRDDSSAEDTGRVMASFTADIATTTRAVDTQWTPGDQIGIYMAHSGESLSPSSIVDFFVNVAYQTAGTADFTSLYDWDFIYYPASGSVDFYAYYPYADVLKYTQAIDVSDQTDQESIDFLYAKPVTGKHKDDPAVALQFSHQLCKLVMTVEPGTGMTAGTKYCYTRVSLNRIATQVMGTRIPWDDGSHGNIYAD